MMKQINKIVVNESDMYLMDMFVDQWNFLIHTYGFISLDDVKELITDLFCVILDRSYTDVKYVYFETVTNNKIFKRESRFGLQFNLPEFKQEV